MKCPYNDCGWCYATNSNAFSTGSQCIDKMLCPVYGEILKEAWDWFLSEPYGDLIKKYPNGSTVPTFEILDCISFHYAKHRVSTDHLIYGVEGDVYQSMYDYINGDFGVYQLKKGLYRDIQVFKGVKDEDSRGCF